MIFSRNGSFLLVFTLLGGSSASNPIGGPITGDMTRYETTISSNPSVTAIAADIVVPSGSTAVVDLALITKGGSNTPSSSAASATICLSSLCRVTLTPIKIQPGVPTWIQHLQTTVTVPESSTPVIHFSSIVSGEASTTLSGTTTPEGTTPSTTTRPGGGTTQSSQESPSPSGVLSKAPSEKSSESSSGSVNPSESTPSASSTSVNTEASTEGIAPNPSQSTSPSPGTSYQPSASKPWLSGQSSTSLTAPNIGTASASPISSGSTSSSTSATAQSSTKTAATSGQPSARPSSQSGQPSTPLATPGGSTERSSPTAGGSTASSSSVSPSLSTSNQPPSGQPSASTYSSSAQSSTPLVNSNPDNESATASSSESTTFSDTPASQSSTNALSTSGQPSASTSLQSGRSSTPLATSNTNNDSPSTKTTSPIGGSSMSPTPATSGYILNSDPWKSSSDSSSGGTTSAPDSSRSTQLSNPSSASSFSLGSSPDRAEMSSMLATLSGTSSAEINAMLSLHPTETATVAWESLSEEMSHIPTTAATTGGAEATQGLAVAAWIGKLGSNINSADLKDKRTWTEVHDNIEKAKDRVENYVKERSSSGSSGGESSETGCSSGAGGLSSLFKAASCVINEAQESLSKGVKDIGNSINSAWDLTKTGLSEIEAKMPEANEMSKEQQQKFKSEFDNISEIAAELEELEKQEEKKRTESNSKTFTDSDSTTCTSTKTVTDCSSTTILISTTTTGHDGSATPSTSTTTTNKCSTKTGCDVTATTDTTTLTTGSACSKGKTTSTSTGSTFSITQADMTITDGTDTITVSLTLPPFTGTQTEDDTTISLRPLTPISDVTSGTDSKSSPGATATATSSTPSTSATSTSALSTQSTTSSDMCELQVYASTYSVCSCSYTTGGHTLSHAMVKPSGKDCSDIKTFPMTSFIQVPTKTPTSTICSVTQKDLDGNRGDFCYCSTTSSSEAIASLPYTMGSMTILSDCGLITQWPSSTVSSSGSEKTQPTVTISDYTSTDIGNGREYIFTAGKEYYDYNNYGISNTAPVTMTSGIGSPMKEVVHGWTETKGNTEYAYAEATGADNDDLKGVGSPTHTAVTYSATGSGDPSKEFYIGIWFQNSNGAFTGNQQWKIWNPKPGKEIKSFCDGTVASADAPDTISRNSWPGSFNFEDFSWGDDAKVPDCKYTKASDSPGTLSCDGSDPVRCTAADKSDYESSCGKSPFLSEWTVARVHCKLY